MTSERGSTPAPAPSDYDVIGVEVHRKAMEQVAREMGITLVRTSGSPVVTDAKDLSCTILDENHEQIGFSGYVSFHVATSVLAVEAILRNYELEDIRPGDAFIANDPHNSGAIHQGDVGIVMPYFIADELVGWGYVNEHLLDVGGSSVSGFAPEAKDVFSEALRFPGVRIVRDHQLSSDWELFIAGNVRAPVPVINDIRSMIAALHTGEDRYLKALEEYGLDRHREYCAINKQLSEQMIRNRIELLPDGVYRATEWVEYDGQGIDELHEFTLELTIAGDEIKFAYRGVPQVPAYINGAVPAMLGQTMTTIQMMFLYDVPVNAGLWPAFEFDLGPQGTIVNSVPPAPVSQSHIETGMRVNRIVANLLSQAMALSPSPEVRARVCGEPNNGTCCFVAAGTERGSGRPTVIFPVSPAGPLGGPAQTVVDGLDTYSTQCSPGFNMPSVETDESTGPIRVLWRRILPSSGGAGESRGGNGGTCALAIRGSERMAGAAFNSVAEIPPGGSGGGAPGAATGWHLVLGAALEEHDAAGEVVTEQNLGGAFKRMPAKTGSLVIEENDVFVVRAGGGGGLGDPLLRTAARVAKDVRDGYVSEAVAQGVYGVALTAALEVDEEATAARRAEIRRQRIGAEPARRLLPPERLELGVSIGVRNGNWICARCTETLGPLAANYRDACVSRSEPVTEVFGRRGMQVRGRDENAVVLWEHFCPSCASSVRVDVALDGGPLPPAPELTEPGASAAERAAAGSY
jgi:N-methylhydantoinase B